MVERRYTLAELTAAMGPAYKAALREKNVERALRLFSDHTVEALKKSEVELLEASAGYNAQRQRRLKRD